jgi:hypothetical protein
MSKFSQAINISYTQNGAVSYTSPDSSGNYEGRLSLFFKGVRNLNAPQLYNYLKKSARENILDTFLLVFHLRDCRGGKGERELGRRALCWLFINYPTYFMQVAHLIPEYGRWDDLLQFFPGVLDLTDLEKVNKNYLSEITSQEWLKNLKRMQYEIVDIMANQLKKDFASMEQGLPCSLCAKWTPTEGNSLDRKTKVFSTLAQRLNVSTKVLRQKYNTPLRTYLKIVERYICTQRWDEIEYDKVPTQTMLKLKKSFQKNDPDRFNFWMENLKLGKTKVNSKLDPYEIIRKVRQNDKNYDVVLETQWKNIVAEVKKIGMLKDCIPLVDTSSSMYTPKFIPIDVAISLGILISEVVSGQFHGHLLNFNDKCNFTVLNDDITLREKYLQVKKMDWGGSTNLKLAFEIILERALRFNLTESDMPKRLIILSDMQFDKIDKYSTNLEEIDRMYKKYNYTRPKIVFWNVNGDSTDFPSTTSQGDTCLISGFSPVIIQCLTEGKKFSCINILRDTLDNSRYKSISSSFEDYSIIDIDEIKN